MKSLVDLKRFLLNMLPSFESFWEVASKKLGMFSTPTDGAYIAWQALAHTDKHSVEHFHAWWFEAHGHCGANETYCDNAKDGARMAWNHLTQNIAVL